MVDPFVLGVMAHIEGENEGSARFNSMLPVPDRAKYDNLILLCPTCHETIDKDPMTYTVERLRTSKTAHETFVSDSINTTMPDVTYADLDPILKYMIGVPLSFVPETVTLIPLQEKIPTKMASRFRCRTTY